MAQVAKHQPSFSKKRVSPHTTRCTTATHLLRAGVSIHTIRARIGHVCIATTYIYAEVDLEKKLKAMQQCELRQEKLSKPWGDENKGSSSY